MTGAFEPTSGTSLRAWVDAIAAGTATPAGGAAAAIVAALAASLAAMVAKLTTTKDQYAAAHDQARQAAAWADRARSELLSLAEWDAATFAEFVAALALPRDTDEQRGRREEAKRGALLAGARVQSEVLSLTVQVARTAEAMARSGLASAVGDAATASFLCTAASRSAYWAIRSNLRSAGQPTGTGLRLDTALEWVEEVEAAERRVRQLLDERI